MDDEERIHVYRGTLVHSTESEHLQILADRAIGVKCGQIVFIEKGFILPETQAKERIRDDDIYHVPDGWFIMPGFVDCQINSAQYPFVGSGTDLTPLDWLSKYKQPALHKMHDDLYAAKVADKVVKQSLRHGTTTALYSPSAISSAVRILCNTVASLRQRALVGLEIYLGMHQIELHESQIELAEDLVKYILKKQNRLLRPYLNQRWLLPRPLEERLEQLQEQYDIPLQTTLAKIPRGMELLEHRDWIDMGRSSTQHLWQAGVLNEKTILSHCVHCSDDDFDLIKKRESSVVHCSTSNLAMSRGICDVRKLLDKDIKVGLGTDVASGSSMSMLDVIRQCVQLSKVVKLSRPGHYRSITTKEAFTLATLGGATVLGLKRLIGNFEVGKEFDAILVDPDVEGGPFDLFLDTDSAEDVVERFLNLGDDRNIREVYVSGRKVHPT